MDGGDIGQRAAVRHGAGQGIGDRLGRVSGRRAGRYTCGRKAYRLQHVMRAAHQRCAIAQQHVAPCRAGIEGVTRHRQHLAPLIGGGARSDQAAGPCRSLDHHHSTRQPRDDAVPLREMTGLWHKPHRLFRHAAALGRDLRGKLGIFFGVDDIHTASHHRHGAAVQRRTMRLGVDAARKARDHHLPRLPQAFGKPACHPQAQRRGVARTHHRHHRARQQRHIAQGPKDRRRIGQIHQRGRIIWPAPIEQPCPRQPPLRHFMPDHLDRANGIVFHASSPRHLGQGRQGGSNRAVFRHQPVKGHRPHPARPDQPQPVGGIFARTAMCRVISRCQTCCHALCPALDSQSGQRKVNER